MIKYLPIPLHLTGGGGLWHRSRCNTIELCAAKLSLSGTWIAISPNEIIPEKYINKVEDRQDFRLYYEIPDDWKLIKISDESSGQKELRNKVIYDIYSIPGHRIIKEMTVSDGYLWAVASGDLNYPMCHDRLVLDEFPWVETSDWKLICIGTSFDLDMTRKVFKESIDPDIIYEEAF